MTLDGLKNRACIRCGVGSGDDWIQCHGKCPIEGSPHFDADILRLYLGESGTTLRDRQWHALVRLFVRELGESRENSEAIAWRALEVTEEAK